MTDEEQERHLDDGLKAVKAQSYHIKKKEIKSDNEYDTIYNNNESITKIPIKKENNTLINKLKTTTKLTRSRYKE